MDAIIFDLDGTLVDSQQDLAESMNQVLNKAGLPVHPVAAYRRFVGDGIGALVRRALPRSHRDPESLAAFTQAMRDAYALRWNRNTAVYPGVDDMLTAIGSRNIPMAVLSNKPHPMTLKVVSEILPRWRFDAVLGAEAGFARKPDPAGALEIAKRLRLVPERIVYLGDSDTDMFTARAATMCGVGALWGFRDAEELALAGASTLVERPSEVVELFA